MGKNRLPEELAQAIVNKIMGYLGKNINIMDETGRIIASGTPDRIGEYHKPARQAILSGKPVTVSRKEMDSFAVGYVGVNLPIKYKGQVLGVVGVTGEPGEILPYMELVRSMAELLIEQEVLREQYYLDKQALESFVQKLVSGQLELSGEEYDLRAELFGLDPKITRGVCYFVTSPYSSPGKADNNIEKREHSIISSLGNYFTAAKDEVLVRGGGGGIILLKRNVVELASFLKQLDALCRQLTSNYQLRLTAGVGSFGCKMVDIAKSFHEAHEAAQVGVIFHPEQFVFYYENLKLERLAWRIPSGQRNHFVEEVLGGLIHQDRAYVNELLLTLETFFENDCDIERTAKVLFIHRNTVIFRLKKIAQYTGFSAHGSFNDLLHLGLAYLFTKCDRA